MRCGLSLLAMKGNNSNNNWLLFVASLLCVLCCSSACFIRNCPIGGKRSEHMGGMVPQRECLKCGPNGLGQCVGPNICCGKMIGCFINTADTSVCRHENDSPVPCRIEGAPCGPEGDSRCVSNGICCNDEQCVMDNECEASENYTVNKKRERLSQDLLHYVHQLMAAKGYPERR